MLPDTVDQPQNQCGPQTATRISQSVDRAEVLEQILQHRSNMKVSGDGEGGHGSWRASEGQE